MFNVVKFTDTDEVEVVSSSWLQEGEEGELCFWPPNFKSKKLKKALLDGQEPDATWITYKVTVLGTYGICLFFHFYTVLWNYKFLS